jgi:hypothetical protein
VTAAERALPTLALALARARGEDHPGSGFHVAPTLVVVCLAVFVEEPACSRSEATTPPQAIYCTTLNWVPVGSAHRARRP